VNLKAESQAMLEQCFTSSYTGDSQLENTSDKGAVRVL
jgi:hypothetical protein